MLYDPKWTPPATEIKLEPWQEILLKAAEIIEKLGWIQGSLETNNGVCMFGALNRAKEYYRDQHVQLALAQCNFSGSDGPLAAVEIAADHIASNLGQPGWVWNDKYRRTKEEVVSKLREVAHAI